MPNKPIRLVLIAEFHDASTVEDAQAALDAFREAVLPEMNYDITLYQATERDADTAMYAPGVDADAQ